MKHTHLLFILLFSLPFLSLKIEKPRKLYTGTFGVCDCQEGKPRSFTFELTLNEDHTFIYVDDTDPAKPINTKGVWRIDDKTISLGDYQSAVPINKKWRVDKNERCIKSNMGMEFTRLCLVRPCAK